MKRILIGLLALVASACVPPAAPIQHAPATVNGPIGVSATIAGAAAADVTLDLHTGEQGTTNADGYFLWPSLTPGARHLIATKGECRGERDVEPQDGTTWPIALTCPKPPKPAFVSTSRPLIGPLRVENKLFRDDTGNRRVLFASWFTALRVLRDNPTEFYRQLDAIAAAGYQGARVFAAVGGWMDFWDGHEVAPITYRKWHYNRDNGGFLDDDRTRPGTGAVIEAWPDYDDLYRTLLRAFKQRGLKLHVTFGDMQIIVGNDQAKEIALHQRLAWIAAEEGGTDVIALAEMTNEFPFNRFGGSSPSSIAQMGRLIDVWRHALSGVLTAQGAIPQDEEPASLTLASTYGQLVISHTTRKPVAIGLKRTLGLIYYEGNYRGFPKAIWQGEPAGPGEDSFDRVDDPASLTALYAIHALTGQASNQFSGPAVRSKQPLESVWGFKELPAILAQLPEDIATWNRETAGRGAILYWSKGTQFATATFEEWDSTPPRPVAEWTLYAGDRVTHGTGTPPQKITGLLVGRFQ